MWTERSTVILSSAFQKGCIDADATRSGACYCSCRQLRSGKVRAAVLESAPASTSTVEAVSTVEDLRALMFKQGKLYHHDECCL